MSEISVTIRNPKNIRAAIFDCLGEPRVHAMMSNDDFTCGASILCSVETAREIITKLEAALDGVPA